VRLIENKLLEIKSNCEILSSVGVSEVVASLEVMGELKFVLVNKREFITGDHNIFNFTRKLLTSADNQSANLNKITEFLSIKDSCKVLTEKLEFFQGRIHEDNFPSWYLAVSCIDLITFIASNIPAGADRGNLQHLSDSWKG
jgi:hypothetical protein